MGACQIPAESRIHNSFMWKSDKSQHSLIRNVKILALLHPLCENSPAYEYQTVRYREGRNSPTILT
jgi:hypothetical protein